MKSKICLFILTTFLMTHTVLAASLPRHAPNMYVDWYSTERFDAIEIDWYCEKDADCTYWAVHNWDNGYAGFQNKDGKHVLLLSLWDLPDGTEPEIEFALGGKNGTFGGEGTGKQVFTNYNWQVGKWYSMRVQIDEEDNKIVFSQWIKEEKGTWEKTAAISYHHASSYFNRVSVFQEDFTFNNKMRSCRLKNARGKNIDSGKWEFLKECEITNSFFPTDEATWEHGVQENVSYDCDWGATDSYVWIQSGGQDFTSNGKTIPSKFTVNEDNTVDDISEKSKEQPEYNHINDKNENKNWFAKFMNNIWNWIKKIFNHDKSSQPTIEKEDSQSSVSESYIYDSEYLGKWYYSHCTSDWSMDDIFEADFIAVDYDTVEIHWQDGEVEEIKFVSSNKAISNSKKNTCYVLYDDTNEQWICDEPYDINVSIFQSSGFHRSLDAFSLGKAGFLNRYNNLEKCEEKAYDGPQQQMNIESASLANSWDELMDNIKLYLKKTMTEAEYKEVIASEQQWLDEKEKAMNAVKIEYSGGTLMPMMVNIEAINYDKERCKYLISLIKE